MTDVVICVGSSCHLKGARRVVEGLTKLVTERGLTEKVNGEIHFVDPDHIEMFFDDVIAGGNG